MNNAQVPWYLVWTGHFLPFFAPRRVTAALRDLLRGGAFVGPALLHIYPSARVGHLCAAGAGEGPPSGSTRRGPRTLQAFNRRTTRSSSASQLTLLSLSQRLKSTMGQGASSVSNGEAIVSS